MGLRISAVLVGCVLMAPAPALTQQSRCADCHFAHPEAPGERHLSDWDGSPHGRAAVGCESCHGGDPTTFEPFVAHRDILSSADPESPTNRWNLHQTCGRCHIGPFVAFQESRHDELLHARDSNAPTCVTCHGEVGAQLLSPKGLESQCAACHGVGRVAENPEYPVSGRQMMEQTLEVRDLLDAAMQLIDRVRDRDRRANLEADYRQAEVPLIQAVQSGHRFVFDDLNERLALARERIVLVFERLLNSGG